MEATTLNVCGFVSLDLTNWAVSVEFGCLWCVNLFGQFLIDD